MGGFRRINKSIIIIIIAILITATICGSVYVFDIIRPQEKRGLIIVPGVLMSGLYDVDTGNPVWDPFYDEDIWLCNYLKHSRIKNIGLILELLESNTVGAELEHLMANDGYGDGQSFVAKLAQIDEDGKPLNNIQPISYDSDDRYKYGMLNGLSDVANYYQKMYGDAYDVSIFHYDWRLDCLYNAELLEEYINQKGYDKIILVSHSEGSLVTAGYLARGEENRDKVSLHLSYNGLYQGSFTILQFLEMQDEFGIVLAKVANYPGLRKYMEIIKNAYLSQAKSLFNMYILYQLLPTYEMIYGTDYYTEYVETVHSTVKKEVVTKDYGKSAFVLDGDEDRTLKSQRSLYRFYCSRPWAKKSDGTLREPMKKWLEYTNSMYVENENGEKVHVTQLVNTVYVAGIDCNTQARMYYEKDENKEYRYIKTESNLMGDGVVSLGSATAGSLDEERIIINRGYAHVEIITNFYYEGAKYSERVFEEFLPETEKVYLKWKQKNKK